MFLKVGPTLFTWDQMMDQESTLMVRELSICGIGKVTR